MLFGRSLTTLALLTLLLSFAVRAEEIDNQVLKKMIEGDLSASVVSNLIAKNQNDCHFTDKTDDLVAISQACKKAKWEPKDIDQLLNRVTELSKKTVQDNKSLVQRFLNGAINADDEQAPQQYKLNLNLLVRAGSAVVPYLLEALTHENERERGGALAALAEIGDRSPAVVNSVMQLLFDDQPRVRANAAIALGSIGDDKAGEKLLGLLRRSEKQLDGVALAIGKLHYEKGIPALVDLLKTSLNAENRIAAAHALGELRAKDPSAREALLKAILDERLEKLRYSAARSAMLIGDPRTPSFVLKAFERFHSGRADILGLLRYCKSIPAAEFLVSQLDNSDNAEIRKVAQETLENMTAEKYATREEWEGFIKTLSIRPGWSEKSEPRDILTTPIPDAR